MGQSKEHMGVIVGYSQTLGHSVCEVKYSDEMEKVVKLGFFLFLFFSMW